mmetsp:Transcript_57789/g.125704  ORF Transcript_57789/g.125704 Transcript_57789/m.125704 type:complete len:232 (+) Transcript_57789:99-794(+)
MPTPGHQRRRILVGDRGVAKDACSDLSGRAHVDHERDQPSPIRSGRLRREAVRRRHRQLDSDAVVMSWDIQPRVRRRPRPHSVLPSNPTTSPCAVVRHLWLALHVHGVICGILARGEHRVCIAGRDNTAQEELVEHPNTPQTLECGLQSVSDGDTRHAHRLGGQPRPNREHPHRLATERVLNSSSQLPGVQLSSELLCLGEQQWTPFDAKGVIDTGLSSDESLHRHDGNHH